MITALNDFVFCPISIYFHKLDTQSDDMTIQSSDQLNGKASHHTVDNGIYSDRKAVLTVISVYSEKYGLFGKIDIFDSQSGVLTERKRISRQFMTVMFFTFTSVVIQRAIKFGFFIACLTSGFRLYSVIGAAKDGNTLLKQKQYAYKSIDIGKRIVYIIK